MKKTLILVVTYLLFSSTAFAKTQGHYVGVNILKHNTEVATSKDSSTGNLDTYFNGTQDNSSRGIGLSYGHAFNFDRIFVMPSIAYELINSENKTRKPASGYEQDFDIKSRLVLKTNIGYDVTDAFSVYVPIGIASNSYKYTTNDYLGSSYVKTEQTGSSTGFIYGAGVSYEVSDKFNITLEYNRSSFDVTTEKDVALVGNVKLKTETQISTVSLGAAYRF